MLGCITSKVAWVSSIDYCVYIFLLMMNDCTANMHFFSTDFNLICRGIDYAIANGETPENTKLLPMLMKQVFSTVQRSSLSLFPFFWNRTSVVFY